MRRSSKEGRERKGEGEGGRGRMGGVGGGS